MWFCAVATGRPLPVDWEEPEKVAESVRLMEVKHCVITSVDRDELKDGGSIVWAETVQAVRRKKSRYNDGNPDTRLQRRPRSCATHH